MLTVKLILKGFNLLRSLHFMLQASFSMARPVIKHLPFKTRFS